MSLLLDALKRAEQEKLAKQGERAEPERARAVSRAPANEPAAGSLELAPITPAASGAGSPPPVSGAARADSAAAQNVFQAKGGTPGERARKGVWLWVGLGAVVIAVAGVGIYVWLALQSFTPRAPASARPRAAPAQQSSAPQDAAPKIGALTPAPQPSATAFQTSAPAIQPPAAAFQPFAAAAQPPAAAFQPFAAPIQPPATLEVQKAAPGAAGARREPRELLAALVRDSARPPVAAPLTLAPSSQRPRVPAEVAAGYEALRNGDVASARRSYAAAIAADPSNIDAQLGAATIEARSGNRMLATSHYRNALDLDPRNATALAGLASIADFSQPEGLESRLRGDLARNPQSPQLNFTLGNLYASQSRWNEAQAAYFEAHRLDPANADILYNLAVSIDHLGQARLAADFYRRTLEAARGQATQFDPAPVARRLAELR